MDWAAANADLTFAFERYSRAVWRATKFIKIVLFIGGAAIATAALAVDIAHANGEISGWTMAGLAGAALVALGSIFDTIRETDAAAALVIAHRAIDSVRERERQLDDVFEEHGRFDKAVTRGLDLYNSVDVMRGAIEQSLDLPDIDTPAIIQTCLSASSNSLLGAFDFGIKDIWTICVYRAQRDGESGNIILRCVAHLRKIPCEITEARSWPEGVGVAGIAYSMNKEIVIADMASPETMAMFDHTTMARDYDRVRYSSMVAVPITIGANPRPWGVAVATSDQTAHFSTEPSYGVSTTEPVRAIAAMTALAAKAAEAAGRRGGSVAENVN